MLVRNENKSALILRIKNRHRYFLRTCIHAFTHARKHTHEINKGFMLRDIIVMLRGAVV